MDKGIDPQKMVEQHFKNGGTLTVLECWSLYHTTELRRIVSRLKHSGMSFASTWEKREQSRWKRYWMV